MKKTLNKISLLVITILLLMVMGCLFYYFYTHQFHVKEKLEDNPVVLNDFMNFIKINNIEMKIISCKAYTSFPTGYIVFDLPAEELKKLINILNLKEMHIFTTSHDNKYPTADAIIAAAHCYHLEDFKCLQPYYNYNNPKGFTQNPFLPEIKNYAMDPALASSQGDFQKINFIRFLMYNSLKKRALIIAWLKDK